MSTRTVSLMVILGLMMVTTETISSSCSEGNVTVAELLDLATDSYAEGSLEQALCQLETAQIMIAAELDDPPLPEPPPIRSNATKLLIYLDLYGMYARGGDPELDEAWSYMTELLVAVENLESFPEPPGRIHGMQVQAWTDGQVHRIGDVRIGHWADGQINCVGDYGISYWADGTPIQIGGIRYGYYAGEQMPYKVAGSRID